MTAEPVYILGGTQTDFARNWHRQNATLFDMFSETVRQGLEQTQLDPEQVDVGHVGNFVADLFTGQAQLGGFFGHVDPAMQYMPASRHEAACASGSMAALAAMSDLQSGRYDLACVLGIEMMRNVDAAEASDNLRPAARVDEESQDTPWVWPCAFDELTQEYQRRYDVRSEHLTEISQKNYANARRNPNAQTRRWEFAEAAFEADDEANPVVCGAVRRQDCGQITDGAAVVFLASHRAAQKYAEARGHSVDQLPCIRGWGHTNAPMRFADKLRLSDDEEFVFPHVHSMIAQALSRAGLSDVSELDGLEVHDCFSITEYMILDHCDLYPAGQVWQGIEQGRFLPGGDLPVNASGGLIGLGHPVGATGVRMLLDAWKQVTGQAAEYQIAEADNVMTVNIGGSTTTCAGFVVGRH